MTSFFNDLFRSLNINVIVTEEQALEAIKSIDKNYDGSVNKAELFNAFRIMLNTPPPQPVQPNYGGYTQYPSYGGGYQPYQQQPYYGGQYPQQGYQNYMGQPNPYMNTSYPQNYQPGSYGGGYMNQSTTGYMNQSYQPPQQNNQPYNPYNSYKKWISLKSSYLNWQNFHNWYNYYVAWFYFGIFSQLLFYQTIFISKIF